LCICSACLLQELRAAFLFYCKSSIRVNEMHLVHEGPFMAAQQFVALCKDYHLLEPEGEETKAAMNSDSAHAHAVRSLPDRGSLQLKCRGVMELVTAQVSMSASNRAALLPVNGQQRKLQFLDETNHLSTGNSPAQPAVVHLSRWRYMLVMSQWLTMCMTAAHPSKQHL
jgi:hypothetical protein